MIHVSFAARSRVNCVVSVDQLLLLYMTAVQRQFVTQGAAEISPHRVHARVLLVQTVSY